MRYIGDDDTGENLQLSELELLRQFDMKVALVWQTGKSFVLERSGTECAIKGLEQARALGMPEDRPIYFSVDFNPNFLTDEQWLTIKDFFSDAGSVLGLQRVGVYGGRRALMELIPQWATWGWQTYGWSGSPTQWDPRANVKQYLNRQIFCGGEVDFDVSVTEDFGQW